MANQYTLAVARKNEALDAIRDNPNGGKLRIYAGTMPANADASLGGASLLAELTLNATAFAAASGGVLTANAITSAVASGTGTASFCRIYESDGTTFNSAATVLSAGEIELDPPSELKAGTWELRVKITFEDDTVSHYPNNLANGIPLQVVAPLRTV